MQISSRHTGTELAFRVKRVVGILIVLIGLCLGLTASAAVHGGVGFHGGHGFRHFPGGHGFHGGHSSFALHFGFGYGGFYPYYSFGWPAYYPYRYSGYYPAYGYGVSYSEPSIAVGSDPPSQNSQAAARIPVPPAPSALYTELFPNGDRGGTRFYVKAAPGRATISLHKFWDDLLTGSQRIQTIKNIATELRSRSDHARTKLPELDVDDFGKWAKDESFKLAVEKVYRSGKLSSGIDKELGELLPFDYAADAKQVAERRAVLAGYRLADVLISLYADIIVSRYR